MQDKLLIVDDSSFSRRMIRRAVPKAWDVEVFEVDGGKEALALCQEHRFDYVFLDLTMPEMDGIEVLQHLKAMHYPARVFVISADIQLPAQREAKALGAAAFIPKPVTNEQLSALLLQEGVYECKR